MAFYTAGEVLGLLEDSETDSEIEEDPDFPLPTFSDSEEDDQPPPGASRCRKCHVVSLF